MKKRLPAWLALSLPGVLPAIGLVLALWLLPVDHSPPPPEPPQPGGPEIQVGPQMNFGPRINIQNGQMEFGPNFQPGPYIGF